MSQLGDDCMHSLLIIEEWDYCNLSCTLTALEHAAFNRAEAQEL